jgi:hypothetical protein
MWIAIHFDCKMKAVIKIIQSARKETGIRSYTFGPFLQFFLILIMIALLAHNICSLICFVYACTLLGGVYQTCCTAASAKTWTDSYGLMSSGKVMGLLTGTWTGQEQICLKEFRIGREIMGIRNYGTGQPLQFHHHLFRHVRGSFVLP